jgi:hypothetical protein
VGVEDDGAEVADGGFVGGGVQGDLGAEVAAVNHADVVLGAADVAGILEGDPGMPGLEDHLQHLLSTGRSRELPAEDLAAGGLLLVLR